MKKNIIIMALALALVTQCVVCIGLYCSSRGNREAQTDTVRVVAYDTVRYAVPVAKDSMVVRYVTRLLPSRQNRDALSGEGVKDKSLSLEGQVLIAGRTSPSVCKDSCAVSIPITQKVYDTEDYRAYVSGYEPQLDSIFVYRKSVTETVTLRENPKERWYNRFGVGVGVGVGYGIVHKQADIFVGGMLTYRIWP